MLSLRRCTSSRSTPCIKSRCWPSVPSEGVSAPECRGVCARERNASFSGGTKRASSPLLCLLSDWPPTTSSTRAATRSASLGNWHAASSLRIKSRNLRSSLSTARWPPPEDTVPSGCLCHFAWAVDPCRCLAETTALDSRQDIAGGSKAPLSTSCGGPGFLHRPRSARAVAAPLLQPLLGELPPIWDCKDTSWGEPAPPCNSPRPMQQALRSSLGPFGGLGTMMPGSVPTSCTLIARGEP
mmetsp:Transcript_14558/g.39407  ORF Transcript_14558/g.39407 Transcript_14558/m.39407 type:complete len:240 (+) Transcript_14558:2182-2901(+)